MREDHGRRASRPRRKSCLREPCLLKIRPLLLRLRPISEASAAACSDARRNTMTNFRRKNAPIAQNLAKVWRTSQTWQTRRAAMPKMNSTGRSNFVARAWFTASVRQALYPSRNASWIRRGPNTIGSRRPINRSPTARLRPSKSQTTRCQTSALAAGIRVRNSGRQQNGRDPVVWSHPGLKH